jgi:hypothetical protein
MKRIISVIGLALVIGALTATSALAGGHKVKAPNASSQGEDNGNPPTREQKACIPDNQGTDTAKEESPAVTGFCSNFIN